MAESRVEKYDHHVNLSMTGEEKELYVSWNGFRGRHGYFMAESVEDLDILLTEMCQALNNYKIKLKERRFT